MRRASRQEVRGDDATQGTTQQTSKPNAMKPETTHFPKFVWNLPRGTMANVIVPGHEMEGDPSHPQCIMRDGQTA